LIKDWIKAARLRTLPLASAGIVCGSLLAGKEHFSWTVFGLLLSTALLLQVLSNLANDYGDFKKGTDNTNRKGEKRMVSSGAITPRAMLKGVIIFALMSFASGILLLRATLHSERAWWVFLGGGILAIIAAITYTMGKRAYGYSGFGDVAVFAFFGLAGVGGSYYLLSGDANPGILLPAAAVGFLSTGVLNLNNLRDHENDRNSGKNTLVVKMGFEKAKLYHTILLALPVILGFIFTALYYRSWYQLMFLVTAFILVRLSATVKHCQDPALLDNELKKLALTTLLFAFLLGLGNYIS
jgi:1,4-dihydroxy-2-naphthoate octaprenyltransferase